MVNILRTKRCEIKKIPNYLGFTVTNFMFPYQLEVPTVQTLPWFLGHFYRSNQGFYGTSVACLQCNLSSFFSLISTQFIFSHIEIKLTCPSEAICGNHSSNLASATSKSLSSRTYFRLCTCPLQYASTSAILSIISVASNNCIKYKFLASLNIDAMC